MKYFVMGLLCLFALSGCNSNVRVSNENAKVLFDYTQKVAESLLEKPEVRDLPQEQICKIEAIASIAASGKAALKSVTIVLKDSSSLFGEGVDVQADVTLEDLDNNLERSLGIIDARTVAADQEAEHSIYKRIKNSTAAFWTAAASGSVMTVLLALWQANKSKVKNNLITFHKKEAEDFKNISKINANYARNAEKEMYSLTASTDLKTVMDKHKLASAAQQEKYNVTDKMGLILTEVKRDSRKL